MAAAYINSHAEKPKVHSAYIATQRQRKMEKSEHFFKTLNYAFHKAITANLRIQLYIENDFGINACSFPPPVL